MVLLSSASHAQDSTLITITGTVKDVKDPNAWMNLMVVNTSTGQGTFGDGNGRFLIAIHKSDTILIGCMGYATKKLCFNDSVFKPRYDITVFMLPLQQTLPEVEVFPQRELDAIYRDIEKLGYDKRDYTMTGVNVFASPITALYMAYSKRERSRREVARLENEDRRRDLLKELLRKYVDADIIQLTNQEFDHFIDYCDVSDRFMQTSSQYEFIVFVKNKFKQYSIQNDYFFDPNK